MVQWITGSKNSLRIIQSQNSSVDNILQERFSRLHIPITVHLIIHLKKRFCGLYIPRIVEQIIYCKIGSAGYIIEELFSGLYILRIFFNGLVGTVLARATRVQSQVESYQRLKKWYMMPPCLTLGIIRYGSRVKWSNPGKGVTPCPTPRCNS